MVVLRARTIGWYMDRSPIHSPDENLGAEGKVLRRKGFVLAVIGALLMVLAVLDGWPAA